MTLHRVTRRLHAVLMALGLIVVASLSARAQSDPLLTQYYEVPTYFNPAAAGQTEFLRIRMGGRLQWVGIDHAPQTYLAATDMPFVLLGKRFGVGLMMQQESAGLFKNMSIGAQLGYKIKLLGGELTAGVQLGFVNEEFRGSKVFIPSDDEFHEPDDDGIPNSDVSGNSLDLGVGVFYTRKNVWAGLSLRHANEPTVSFEGNGIAQGGGSAMMIPRPVASREGEDGGGDAPGGGGGTSGSTGVKSYEYSLPRTLYFMAGGNIPVKNTLFEVMPSVMVRSDFTFTRMEANARLRYHKMFTVGVGYRHEDAVIATLGAEYKGFYIGYSFDYPISAIAKASSGSHEIILGYSMKLNFNEKNKNKHKNIRIM